MVSKDLRINKAIQIREVRLIDGNGDQLGIVLTSEARRIAADRGLDLVEVSPHAKPPVCKLLDYGKYRFEQDKRQRESRLRQKHLKLKEIRMQPKIDTHDLQFKTRHIRAFLDEGSKVKVTIRFRGRELAHTEIGHQILMNVLEMLGDSTLLEKPPTMEGRFMTMMVSPGSRNRVNSAETKEQKNAKNKDTQERGKTLPD